MKELRSSRTAGRLRSALSALGRAIRGDISPVHETFELKVHLACDENTGRWYIAESDIPGLWLEGSTPTELIDRIGHAAAELIELNQDEIVAGCRARALAAHQPEPVHTRPIRPRIRPIFDSSFELAYA